LKWQIKGNEKYKWTTCKKLFNVQTGRQIKKTMNCRSIGYWIGKKFITLTNLKNKLEVIPKTKTPFVFRYTPLVMLQLKLKDPRLLYVLMRNILGRSSYEPEAIK
jgi:hypothetical protein